MAVQAAEVTLFFQLLLLLEKIKKMSYGKNK